MQTLAGARIARVAGDLDGELLPYRQAVQPDDAAIKVHLLRGAIDLDLRDGFAQVIQKKLRLAAAEFEAGSHAVGGAIEYLREIEVEVVGAQVHRRCAFLEQLVLRLSSWCGHIYEL